jgi:hypothetical protein
MRKPVQNGSSTAARNTSRRRARAIPTPIGAASNRHSPAVTAATRSERSNASR